MGHETAREAQNGYDIKEEIELDVNLKERIDEHYFNDYNHQTWRIT